ncbi:MAG: glycosyltransferase family 4 protein [Actinomycetota bacterium]
MKLNYVVQAFGADVVGGAESACRRLAMGMAERGSEVTVLTTCAAESTTWANRLPAGEQTDGPVRVVRFPVASERDPRFLSRSDALFRHPDPPRRLQERWFDAQGPLAPGLIDEIRRRAAEPDLWIFYTYLYYPTIYGLPVVGPRALLHPALHDEPAARLPLVREMIRSAAALSLQTPEEWELVLRFAGWPPAAVRMVGMGVEDHPGDAAAFRRRYALGEAPLLLYLGRVDRGKGTDDLAQWFGAFKDHHPGPLRLVIAGPVVHPPPGHDDILVTGRLSDEERWSALEACTIFVNPSPVESFGIALLEAWARSRPALVNARCAVTVGQARRARAGLPYRDAVEFESALEALMDDPAAARRLGANGRAYAEDYFWQRVLERYERFVEDVADGAGNRQGRSRMVRTR